MTDTAAKRRVAFVTGGGSGIGLATAKRLLASGWRVAVADRDEKALEAVRRAHAGSADVIATPLDVTDEGAVETAVVQAAAALGGLDGVVN